MRENDRRSAPEDRPAGGARTADDLLDELEASTGDSTGKTVPPTPNGEALPALAPRLRSSRPPLSAPPPGGSRERISSLPRTPEDAARALIQACEAELTHRPDPLRAARLHFEIGRLHESPLRDLRRATAHYQEALRLAPEHLPALRATRRVLLERKSYLSALPLFDAEARITADASQKAALLFEKGRLLEDVLGKKDEALECYTTALELDRVDRSVLGALEQRYADMRDLRALDRIYERHANAASADPRQRASLLARRAWLLESKLGDPEGAAELYQTALRLDADAAIAVEALKRLLHAQRRWRDLVDVLTLEAEKSTDTAVRASAHYRIARLHAERLGSQDEAIAALERAVEIAPEDPLLSSELAKLYEGAGRHSDVVRALATLARLTDERHEKLGLLHQIGQIHEEKLGDELAAVGWYAAALAEEPTHVPTLQALGTLYAKLGRWEDLLRMHQGEAEHTDEPSRRAAAFARVAEILETRLDRPAEAIDHHARALAVSPGYPPSFKALTRLLADADRPRELVDLYERAVDRATHTSQTITYLFKIGAVYEDRLKEHAQAAHAYRRVLELDPSHLGAIHAMQRATERGGRYRELVEALQLELERTRDPENVVALLHRIGEVLQDKLGERDAALATFRRILDIDPAYVPVLASLGRLYYGAGRWDDLLDIYQRELDRVDDGTRAVTLLVKMGELCQDRIGRDEQAIGYYRRALRMDPTHGPALRALTQKLGERGDFRALAEVLELELSATTDPAARSRTAFRLGELFEERLDEPTKAVWAYTQALESTPGYRPAIDALARVRAGLGAFGPMIADLEREASATRDPALVVAARMRQAAIWSDELNEPRRAIECVERVLELDPSNVGALSILERLYRRSGQWEELARVVRMEARLFEDPDARVAALRELARLQEVRGIGAPGDRAETYEAIVALRPSDPFALSALERVALAAGDEARLLEVTQLLADGAGDASLEAAHRTRLGELLEGRDDEAAMDAFRQALEADPECLGATRGLSRLAERLDDPNTLAEAARREAMAAHDGTMAARLLLRSANVRANRLGDLEGAVTDLERALELWPDSAEAAARISELLAHVPARLADLLARAAGSAKDPERVTALWSEVAALQAESLDNLAGAIRSLNRVLRVLPEHVPSLRQLAQLYARDGQWNEAAQLLHRVIKLGPERDVLRDCHLELATLWSEHLGDGARALVSLQAALALDPSHRETLGRLATLHESEGRLYDAIGAAEALLAASQEPAHASAALVRLARLHHAVGRFGEAAGALRRAVAIEGPGGEADEALASLATSTTDHESHVRALRAHLAEGRAGLDPVPTYLEIARIQRERLRQMPATLDTLREGLAATGEHPALRRALAAALRADGRPAEAIAPLEAVIATEAPSAEDFRELARAYDEAGRLDEARLCRAPLLLLGAALPSDVLPGKLPPCHAGEAVPGTMLPSVYADLEYDDPGHAAASRLLGTLEPALGKLYAVDLEVYGLTSRDRVGTRSDHPTRRLVDRIAATVGAGEVGLFLHRVRGQGVVGEIGPSGPLLMVPSQLGDLPLAQQVFLLAAPLVDVARRLHPMGKLTPRELQVLLASAARLVQPGYGKGLTAEELLDDQARRIQRALPRRARKAAEAAARDYLAGPRVSFPEWCVRSRRTTLSIALLLADDLAGSIEVLRETTPELAGLDGARLVRESPLVRQLARFWVSSRAMDLRRASGLLAARPT